VNRAPDPQVQRDEGPLVRDFVRRFVQAAEDGSVGDLTGRPYERSELRELRDQLGYVETQLGHLALRGVNRSDVQALVSRLTQEGMQPRGVSQVLDSLSALFAYAWGLGLVEDSPVAGVDVPDGPRPAVRSTVDPTPRAPSGPPRSDGAAFSPYVPASGYPDPGPARPGTDPSFASFVAPQTTASTAAAMAASGVTGMMQTFGAPGAPDAPNAMYDATMQERWLWWTARIIVIVFVLIALVLAAESI
jgi:hypothetical protein